MGVSRGKELAKNTAIISVGKICTQLVSFLLMPLYTMILTTEDYGVVDLVITYKQLLLPVVTLQLEQALFRFLVESRKDRQVTCDVISEITALSLTFVLGFSVFYLGIGLFVQFEFKYYLLLNLWACALSQMMLQIARGLGHTMVYAAGSFILAASQLVLNVFFVAAVRLGAKGMLISMMLANLICAEYIVLKLDVFQYLQFRRITKSSIQKYLKYSAPLVPNSISWWILSASDRSIILAFLGVSFNGIYSAAHKFSGIYTILYNIFNLSWTESIALHMKDEDSSEVFNSLQSAVIRLCVTVALGIIACMPFVFRLLVNEKFGKAYGQIPILIIGAFLSSLSGIIGAYYVADKKTGFVAKTSSLCAFLNIVVNLCLIRKTGLYAASISTVVAYFVLFLIRYIVAKRSYGFHLEKSLMSSGILIASILVFTYYLRNYYICALALLLYMIYAVLINRRLLVNIYGEMKGKIAAK